MDPTLQKMLDRLRTDQAACTRMLDRADANIRAGKDSYRALMGRVENSIRSGESAHRVGSFSDTVIAEQMRQAEIKAAARARGEKAWEEQMREEIAARNGPRKNR